MAITIEMLRKKFPAFMLTPDEMIEEGILEATLLMGDDVNRWLGQDIYNMAQLNLVAHLVYVSEGSSLGDTNPLAPIKRTEVDSVEVDYAINSMSADGEEFLGTMYGRRYMMYRKMCFAGPRIA